MAIPDMEGISKNKFEASLDKASGYFNVQKKRNGSPSVDVVQKFVSVYPNYSLQWLLFGEGPVKSSINELQILKEAGENYAIKETTDKLFVKMMLAVLEHPEVRQAIKGILK